MPGQRYHCVVDPHTGEWVPVFGPRAQCWDCGRVFAGGYSFAIHRVGRFEPDERRCLSADEMSAVGLDPKVDGAWGRKASGSGICADGEPIRPGGLQSEGETTAKILPGPWLPRSELEPRAD